MQTVCVLAAAYFVLRMVFFLVLLKAVQLVDSHCLHVDSNDCRRWTDAPIGPHRDAGRRVYPVAESCLHKFGETWEDDMGCPCRPRFVRFDRMGRLIAYPIVEHNAIEELTQAMIPDKFPFSEN